MNIRVLRGVLLAALVALAVPAVAGAAPVLEGADWSVDSPTASM